MSNRESLDYASSGQAAAGAGWRVNWPMVVGLCFCGWFWWSLAMTVARAR